MAVEVKTEELDDDIEDMMNSDLSDCDSGKEDSSSYDEDFDGYDEDFYGYDSDEEFECSDSDLNGLTWD